MIKFTFNIFNLLSGQIFNLLYIYSNLKVQAAEADPGYQCCTMSESWSGVKIGRGCVLEGFLRLEWGIIKLYFSFGYEYKQCELKQNSL